MLWSLAYAWLCIFSFALADRSNWAEMVAKNRILPEYVDYILAIPSWIVALTAICAITRLTGSVGMALYQSWSLWAYLVSLLCTAVIMFRGFVFAHVARVIRKSQIVVEILFLSLSVFAPWFAQQMINQGVLS